jgi:cytochrome c oxidase cbb3-type subunit 3
MAEEYIPNQLRGNPEDADGIEEYDNRLPAWWVGLFYFSIVWAVIVFVDWHVLTPRTQVDAYEEAMANAPQPVDLDEIVVTVTPETVAAGQEIWTANCVACHQADASGGIGPSLIDDVWVHGSAPEDIRNVVALGVLEKGMPPWLSILGADGVANVSAYVVSLGQ